MLNKPHEQNTLDSNKLVLTSSSESEELLEESELDEEEEDEDNLTKHNKKVKLVRCSILSGKQLKVHPNTPFTISSFSKYYQWNFTSKKLVLHRFS